MKRVDGQTQCVTCKKTRTTAKCNGCLKNYCYNHLGEHLQELGKGFEDVENQRNLFQQSLLDQKINLDKHPLLEQVDQWEIKSIEKIKQIASESRELILKHLTEHMLVQEILLNLLTEDMIELRKENDFNEIDLKELKKELKELEKQTNQYEYITIKEETLSTSFISKISILTSSPQRNIPKIPINAKWTRNRITVAGGNGKGARLNQLFDPAATTVDEDEMIYVADQSNHCIVEWKKGAISGEVVAGGNGPGNRIDQLNFPSNVIIDHKNDSLIISDRGNNRIVRWPRRNGKSGETIISNIDCWGLALDKNGYLYVCDFKKHEVRRWKIGEKNGTLVAGGNGQGNRLNQFNEPSYIFVDQDQSVYVSDSGNHRVMKWVKGAKEGIIAAGGQGQGNSLTQLSYPCGIIVDQLDTIYIADGSNNRVIRWLNGARKGDIIVTGFGEENKANQFDCPIDVSFDRQNNLYVVDQQNHRLQKFLIE